MFANALGWTLLHALWEGAIAALILSAALCFLRSSRLRYAAACAALVVTLAGFAITLAYLIPSPYAFAAKPAGERLIPPVANSSVFATAMNAPPGATLPPWVLPLWIAGVIVFQLRALGGWIAVRRMRRVGVCSAPDDWRNRLRELASGLRVTKPVVLLQSSLADVPVVIGHLRPVILLPLGLLTGLPAAQIEFILTHELAHILRHDYLVNLLQTFAEGLLFYHPAVWWISSVIRTERENCCDDMVVAVNGNAHEYAVALAALAGNCQAAQGIALAATGGSLLKRIRRLLNQQDGSRPVLAPLIMALVIAATLAAYQTNQPKPPKPAPPAIALPVPGALPATPAIKMLAQVKTAPGKTAAPAAVPDTPWRKWMNEDVAYIITDEERAAFKQLGTDEEREKFVEQFWQRRDPTPGTSKNEFKEDIYRRIAYANVHFSDNAGLPGWKTDRGRVYITYGPPDEIDSHPSGDRSPRPAEQGGGVTRGYPFELWRYRYIEGLGNDVRIEFADITATGEYRMTMDPSEKDALLSLSPQVTVEARPGGLPFIKVPINPETTQFNAVVTVGFIGKPGYAGTLSYTGTLCRNSPVAGCLEQPVYQPDLGPLGLSPGTYTLAVVVTDQAGGVRRHASTFTVK